MKRKHVKIGPRMPVGRYIESGDDIRYTPATDAAIALRDSLAASLGYAKRNPCSFNAPGSIPAVTFDCWESAALDHTYKGCQVASFHSVHESDLSRYGAPKGCIGLRWPDDVEAAAAAVEKAKG